MTDVAAEQAEGAVAGYLDLAADELTVVQAALGIRAAVFGPDRTDRDPAEQAVAIDDARLSLLQRGLLRVDELVSVVVPALATMIEVAAEPSLLATVRREHRPTGQIIETTVLVLPDQGLIVSGNPGGIFRLTPFLASDLAAQLAALSGLSAPREPLHDDLRGFSVPRDAIAAAFRLTDSGRTDAALGALLAERADETSARWFVSAYERAADHYVVKVSHRTAENRLEGGELHWIDGVNAGLWVVPDDVEPSDFGRVPEGPWPGPDRVPAPVNVWPGTPDQLVAELSSYLPSR